MYKFLFSYDKFIIFLLIKRLIKNKIFHITKSHQPFINLHNLYFLLWNLIFLGVIKTYSKKKKNNLYISIYIDKIAYTMIYYINNYYNNFIFNISSLLIVIK